MKLKILVAVALLLCELALAQDLRIGIIGCDTSHVPAFTEALNNSSAAGHIAGGKVVAAYKGGSPDIPSSASRVDQFANTLRDKYRVTFYENIDELCKNVDAVLLESVDGRPHLEQAKPVLRAHKPLFIDKPIAGSLRDAVEIVRIARQEGTPVFSSSSLRFATNTMTVHNGSLGKVLYSETYGPCELEPHHPDLFWYGVHGVEALYTIMGPGCQTVQRGTTPAGKIEVVGLWGDGRKGVFREDAEFHGIAKGERGQASAGSFDGYLPLVAEVMKFFKTGVAPMKPEETLEIFAFMEAADESKRQGGVPVSVAETLKKAGASR